MASIDELLLVLARILAGAWLYWAHSSLLCGGGGDVFWCLCQAHHKRLLSYYVLFGTKIQAKHVRNCGRSGSGNNKWP